MIKISENEFSDSLKVLKNFTGKKFGKYIKSDEAKNLMSKIYGYSNYSEFQKETGHEKDLRNKEKEFWERIKNNEAYKNKVLAIEELASIIAIREHEHDLFNVLNYIENNEGERLIAEYNNYSITIYDKQNRDKKIIIEPTDKDGEIFLPPVFEVLQKINNTFKEFSAFNYYRRRFANNEIIAKYKEQRFEVDSHTIEINSTYDNPAIEIKINDYRLIRYFKYIRGIDYECSNNQWLKELLQETLFLHPIINHFVIDGKEYPAHLIPDLLHPWGTPDTQQDIESFFVETEDFNDTLENAYIMAGIAKQNSYEREDENQYEYVPDGLLKLRDKIISDSNFPTNKLNLLKFTQSDFYKEVEDSDLKLQYYNITNLLEYSCNNGNSADAVKQANCSFNLLVQNTIEKRFPGIHSVLVNAVMEYLFERGE
jgi:hypothetical protein